MNRVTLEDRFQKFLRARFKVKLCDFDEAIMRDVFFGGAVVALNSSANESMSEEVDKHFKTRVIKAES
jgi:hypothetical protein